MSVTQAIIDIQAQLACFQSLLLGPGKKMLEIGLVGAF